MMQAGVAGLLYTFMLCFVVLNVAASKISCGGQPVLWSCHWFVIVAGAYSGGSVSMGCFNPAVAFGVDIASTKFGVHYCVVYTVFELVGAALAAGLFMFAVGEQESCDTAEEAQTAEVTLGPKLCSEFLGTYMLVLTVGLYVLSGSGAGAFSSAASLMCMILALGTVSGAHFNPAVTTAMICSGRDKRSPKEGAMYMAVQIVGGICAAFTYSF